MHENVSAILIKMTSPSMLGIVEGKEDTNDVKLQTLCPPGIAKREEQGLMQHHQFNK